MEQLLSRSKRKVPSPVIEFTVTSMVAPLLAETESIVPVAVSVEVKTKSLVSTLYTFSLKVTRKVTLVKFVNDSIGFKRSIELMAGGETHWAYSVTLNAPIVKVVPGA